MKRKWSLLSVISSESLKLLNTASLLATIPMITVGGVSMRKTSRCRVEAFQHFKSRWSFLSVTSSESFKLLHASPNAACSLAAGARVAGNLYNHSL